MQTPIDFTKQLVKGRIAETVFSQMFRESGKYTVLEFGYEKIIPELVQAGQTENSRIIETLRTAPDFAIINNEMRRVRLVEVKYRRNLYTDEVLKIAQRMKNSWNPSYLFLCTLDGFYFGSVSKIIENSGTIARLSTDNIPQTTQNEYLGLLKDFERGK